MRGAQPVDGRRHATMSNWHGICSSGRRMVHCAIWHVVHGKGHKANLRTKILDFRGFDSSRILSLRGGILTSIGNFLESLSRGILVVIVLVGRLGVLQTLRAIRYSEVGVCCEGAAPAVCHAVRGVQYYYPQQYLLDVFGRRPLDRRHMIIYIYIYICI